MTAFLYLICVAPCHHTGYYFFIFNLCSTVPSFQTTFSYLICEAPCHPSGDYLFFFISYLRSTMHLFRLLFILYCVVLWIFFRTTFSYLSCIAPCIFSVTPQFDLRSFIRFSSDSSNLICAGLCHHSNPTYIISLFH